VKEEIIFSAFFYQRSHW